MPEYETHLLAYLTDRTEAEDWLRNLGDHLTIITPSPEDPVPDPANHDRLIGVHRQEDGERYAVILVNETDPGEGHPTRGAALAAYAAASRYTTAPLVRLIEIDDLTDQ